MGTRVMNTIVDYIYLMDDLQPRHSHLLYIELEFVWGGETLGEIPFDFDGENQYP